MNSIFCNIYMYINFPNVHLVKEKIGSSHTKETYIKKFGNIQSLKVRFKVLPFFDWLLTRYYNWLGMIPNQIANDRKCRKVVPQKTQIIILIYFLLIIPLYPYPIFWSKFHPVLVFYDESKLVTTNHYGLSD